MKKIIIFILTFIGICSASFSQNNIRGIVSKKSEKERPVDITSNPVAGPVRKSINSQIDNHKISNLSDTIYSADVISRHGWFEPQNILTHRQVEHRNLSYRFTGKNDKGHWTKVESINALGYPVEGAFKTYLDLMPSYLESNLNSYWANRIKKSCLIELISDFTGNNMIQLRAYDEDMNIMYMCSRVPVGKDAGNNDQFIVAYKDANGLSAHMTSENYRFILPLPVILLTQDDSGNDIKIEYLDSETRMHLDYKDYDFDQIEWNTIVKEYDTDGRIIYSCEVDTTDKKIIDSARRQQESYEYEHDKKIKSLAYVDSAGKISKNYHPNSGIYYGVSKAIYDYDEYLRVSGIKFHNHEDKKDLNNFGTHRIVYKYDSLGNIIEMRGFDIDGNPSQLDNSGASVYLYDYEKNKLKDFQLLDLNHQLVRNTNVLCRISNDYNVEGKLVGSIKTTSDKNGNLLSVSERLYIKNNGSETIKTYPDKSFLISKKDKKDREVFIGYFSPDSIPVPGPDLYSYKTTKYDDNLKTTVIKEEFFDSDGSYSEYWPYSSILTRVDSIGNIKKISKYKDGFLIDNKRYEFDKNFSRILSKTALNKYGVPARVGDSKDGRFYKIGYLNPPYDNISESILSYAGVDELLLRDYVVAEQYPYDFPFLYVRSGRNGQKYYTSETSTFSTYDALLKDNLTKIMSIEVVDSTAYKLGLRDNDLILRYGDYHVDTDSLPEDYNSFVARWTVRAVLDASNEKDMFVIRIVDGETNGYGTRSFAIKKISGLKGTPLQLGFIPHVRYLTARHKYLIGRTKKEYSKIYSQLLDSISSNNNGSHIIGIKFPESYMDRRENSNDGDQKEAAIFLGGVDMDKSLIFDISDKKDSFLLDLNLEGDNPGVKLFFTSDGKNVISSNSSGRKIYYLINDADYEKLNVLLKETTKQNKKTLKSCKSLDWKKLRGYWIAVAVDSLSPYGCIQFVDEKNCDGFIRYKGILPENKSTFKNGSMLFNCTKYLKGEWQRGYNNIKFNLGLDEPDEIVCKDILFGEPGLSFDIEYITDKFENGFYKSVFKNEAVCDFLPTDYLSVEFPDSKTLVLKDKHNNEIRFVKTDENVYKNFYLKNKTLQPQ